MTTPTPDDELGKIEAALKPLEALRGSLPDEQLEAMMAPLRAKRDVLLAQINVSQRQGGIDNSGQLTVGSGDVTGRDKVTLAPNATYVAPGATLVQAPKADDATVARKRYLANLSRACKALPLAALGGEEGADEEITLEDVYIDLDTTAPFPKPLTKRNSEKRRQQGKAVVKKEKWHKGAVLVNQDHRPLTTLEAAIQSPKLALLGGPGSGKSTFVRELLAQLADGKAPDGIPKDLLPVLITLRDLAPALAALDLDPLPGDRQRETLAALVRDQAVSDLARLEAKDFEPGLREAFNSSQCLLALDGLDEVPHDLRGLVRRTVQAVVGRYRLARIILTCRVRSYQGEAVLPNFQERILAPFDEYEVRSFASAWYNAQKKLSRFDAEEAKSKAENLAEAALGPDLRELSDNPMMLTTMALIHQKEIGLPRERVQLYKQAVDVLLRRWQKRKTGEAGPSEEMRAFLKDDLRLRATMERLAYEAHLVRAGESDKKEAADLERGDALTLLESREYLGSAALAAEFLDYVDQRAGLLVGRGGEPNRPAVYSFPHRTFQEYLAGCYLVGQRDVARELFARAAEGDDWQLAVRLGAEELLYNRRNFNELLNTAYLLFSDQKGLQAERASLWAGEIAALVGKERVESDDAPGGGKPYLDHLRKRLVNLLGSGLPATERADAGNALGKLDDPRFLPDAWYLPDEPLLGFVEIPEGPFIMGSDPEWDEYAQPEEQPQHELTLPRYFIARYPVTVAQFRAFAKASGYTPRNEDSLLGPPNHPVVNVTWHEACKYCDWLTEALRRWDGTPQLLARLLREGKWRIVLPSEAEWEKAARGSDPDRANTRETGLYITSAVGCFPGGASPYDVLDLSGNVWEWTRSLWGKDYQKPDFNYPYEAKDGREVMDAPDQGLRVLRGGSFISDDRDARCVARNMGSLRHGNWDFGFRVAASPF
ncbi:MAG: SUMF1/EgtB/PvdO family nonheme iron enzyme [Chloroflexi bacterium]|nr:SUMF1/EgtB/PvdO family nonheme iron enzyme [Chloroflexota bacterium]